LAGACVGCGGGAPSERLVNSSDLFAVQPLFAKDGGVEGERLEDVRHDAGASAAISP
jgi:hypothetical protein